MSHVHATPIHDRPASQCRWAWHLEDVDLECTDDAVLGTDLCAGHAGDIAHRQGDGNGARA